MDKDHYMLMASSQVSKEKVPKNLSNMHNDTHEHRLRACQQIGAERRFERRKFEVVGFKMNSSRTGNDIL
jgi:hypothetical protein